MGLRGGRRPASRSSIRVAKNRGTSGFESSTLPLTPQPSYGSLFELSQESPSKQARERISESGPRTKGIGRKRKKDTILTERSYRSSGNKGLSFLRRSKRTGF